MRRGPPAAGCSIGRTLLALESRPSLSSRYAYSSLSSYRQCEARQFLTNQSNACASFTTHSGISQLQLCTNRHCSKVAKEKKKKHPELMLKHLKKLVADMEEVVDTEASIPILQVSEAMHIIDKLEKEPAFSEQAKKYFKRLIEYIPCVSRDNDLFPAETYGKLVKHLCSHGYLDQVYHLVGKAKAEGVGLRYIYDKWLNGALLEKKTDIVNYIWQDVYTSDASVLRLPTVVYQKLIYWYAVRKDSTNALNVFTRMLEEISEKQDKLSKPAPPIMSGLIYCLAVEKKYDKSLEMIERFRDQVKKHQQQKQKQTKDVNETNERDTDGRRDILIDVPWETTSMWSAYGPFFRACVENQDCKTAVKQFSKMIKDGKVPPSTPFTPTNEDQDAVHYLMIACAKEMRYDLVASASHFMASMGSRSLLANFFNVIGNMHSKRLGKENMSYLPTIWANMKKAGFVPLVASYETLFVLCFVNNSPRIAEELLEEMLSKKMEPNDRIKGIVRDMNLGKRRTDKSK